MFVFFINEPKARWIVFDIMTAILSFYLKVDGMQEALISNQETQEMNLQFSAVKLFHCWKISINFQAL